MRVSFAPCYTSLYQHYWHPKKRTRLVSVGSSLKEGVPGRTPYTAVECLPPFQPSPNPPASAVQLALLEWAASKRPAARLGRNGTGRQSPARTAGVVQTCGVDPPQRLLVCPVPECPVLRALRLRETHAENVAAVTWRQLSATAAAAAFCAS